MRILSISIDSSILKEGSNALQRQKKYVRDPSLAKKFVAKTKQLPKREEVDRKYLAFLKANTL